jgi:membrane fusion protein, multidrug efflux system
MRNDEKEIRQAMHLQPHRSMSIGKHSHTRARTHFHTHAHVHWAVLALAPMVAACGSDTPHAEASAMEASARVISVEVETVRPAPFTDFVRIVGAVSANHDVVVAAEEAGVIRQIFVEKGTYVRVGQPIARIDDSVLRAQLERATAEARLAAETWERQRRLWEEEQIGTEMSYLDARYNARAAAASADELRARVARTVVRSPIAGVLDARLVEVGATVSPGAPVARVVDADPVKITGGVPERYAADIVLGAPIRVSFDGVCDVAYTGRVQYVGATLNEQNRTFPIEVRVPNPGRILRPGMVANLQVARRTSGSALLVPQNALLRRDEGQVVYVAVGDGGDALAEVREVVPGASEAGRVVIEQGLSAGERVIVVGQQQVSSGGRLRIVSSREAGTGSEASERP